jgi:hypothetical protein
VDSRLKALAAHATLYASRLRLLVAHHLAAAIVSAVGALEGGGHLFLNLCNHLLLRLALATLRGVKTRGCEVGGFSSDKGARPGNHSPSAVDLFFLKLPNFKFEVQLEVQLDFREKWW